MFTLHQIVKRGVAETIPDKTSRNTTLGTISAPEQDYFAPFLKDVIPARQHCSCAHCTGSVSALLHFTLRHRHSLESFLFCNFFISVILTLQLYKIVQSIISSKLVL